MTLRNTRSLLCGEMASGEQGDLILRVYIYSYLCTLQSVSLILRLFLLCSYIYD